MTHLDPAFVPWLIIAAGSIIGLLARWAVVQSIGQRLGWREVRIDLLVLLANALLAAQFAEVMHIDGTKLAVAAAMFGASSTMIFSALHGRFVAAVSKGPIELFVGMGEVAKLPASDSAVTVHSVQSDDALPEELARLMRELGADDEP